MSVRECEESSVAEKKPARSPSHSLSIALTHTHYREKAGGREKKEGGREREREGGREREKREGERERGREREKERRGSGRGRVCVATECCVSTHARNETGVSPRAGPFACVSGRDSESELSRACQKVLALPMLHGV